MNQRHEQRGLFPAVFDEQIFVGPEEGNEAYFGLNVLRGFVQGIEDFVELRQDRWRRYRSLGPCLIGSAMWIDDAELIAAVDVHLSQRPAREASRIPIPLRAGVR